MMGKKMIRFKKESVLMINKIKGWGKDRCRERTSWDGAALIIVGCVVLFGAAMPAHLAAILGIVYGVATISKPCNCKCPSCIENIDESIIDHSDYSKVDKALAALNYRMIDVERAIHDKKEGVASEPNWREG